MSPPPHLNQVRKQDIGQSCRESWAMDPARLIVTHLLKHLKRVLAPLPRLLLLQLLSLLAYTHTHPDKHREVLVCDLLNGQRIAGKPTCKWTCSFSTSIQPRCFQPPLLSNNGLKHSDPWMPGQQVKKVHWTHQCFNWDFQGIENVINILITWIRPRIGCSVGQVDHMLSNKFELGSLQLCPLLHH